MATYKVNVVLTVTGEHIKSKKDVATELQIMLDSYDDMNDRDSSVCIHIDGMELDK